MTEPRPTILVGDVFDQLATLDDGSVDCVVTSPPYWGLRDYGTGTWEGGDPECDHKPPPTAQADRKFANGRGENEGYAGTNLTSWTYRDATPRTCACGATRTDQQIGLEPTPDLFVARIVQVFREVRRVLAPHGTCWVNLGDSYNANQGAGFDTNQDGGERKALAASPRLRWGKPKDLVGIPWRVALALQADGWWLRSDIIWAKPNPMPESVTDRPTKAHEYVFLLTKRPRYFYDQEAVRETATARPQNRFTPVGEQPSAEARAMVGGQNPTCQGGTFTGRNIRTVWTIPTHPYPEAHFATYPPALVERCVKAGCPKRVCRTCGKPQERIVERGESDYQRIRGERSWREMDAEGLRRGVITHAGDGGQTRTEKGTVPSLRPRSSEMIGWTDCGHDNYRPGLVLDPFLGSGTTSVVALRQGMDAIGIELNPEYAALAEKRIARWWEEPVREREEQIAGQLSFEG